MKVHELAEMCKISKKRIGHILHDELHMRKLSARWVPRLFTIDQKDFDQYLNIETMNILKVCLKLFQWNPQEFMHHFITVDETWTHHYIPETKEQSKQLVEGGGSAPKKAQMVPLVGKVMATIF